MDRAIIDKLLELAAEQDRAALAVMYNAWVKKVEAYRRDDSKANLSEMQAVEKALNAKVAELQAKYDATADAAPLPSKNAALEFLKANGWKISRGKLYKDADAGLLKVRPDGTVSESDALAYASRFLKKLKGGDADPALDGLYREKAQAELDKTRVQEEKLRFELERERGRYILLEDVETQFAVKWAAIEASVRHLLITRAKDWIYAVGGQVEKYDMLITMAGAELDGVFNRLATIEELNLSLVIGGCDSQEEET